MSYALRSSPGSLAMLAAMRRASSFSEELIDAGGHGTNSFAVCAASVISVPPWPSAAVTKLVAV